MSDLFTTDNINTTENLSEIQNTSSIQVQDTSFSFKYIRESINILQEVSLEKIEHIASELAKIKKFHGRLFFLGVGGSASACNHAVNDFRKICGIESYAPTDNVSELTARTNDEGWSSIFIEWLKTSRLNSKDAIFIISVGGGNREKNISPNLVAAIDYAMEIGAGVFGIVGKDGGHTAKTSPETTLVIPVVNPNHITPHTESMHGLFLHLLATHPSLKSGVCKWESTVESR